MKQTHYAIGTADVTKLPDLLDDNVFPISLKIECAPSPEQKPLEYTVQESGGERVDYEFSETRRVFPIYEAPAVWIPRRTIHFVNPLEKGNISSETKQRPRRESDSYGPSYQSDEQVAFADFVDDLNEAESVMGMSSDQSAADRVYLTDLTFGRIPEDCVVTGDEATAYRGREVDGQKLYEEEPRECWIARFEKAATGDSKINMQGARSDNGDGLVKGMVPGRNTVPSTLTSVKQVHTKPMAGRDWSKVRTAYYTEGQAEKNSKPELAPREWSLSDSEQEIRRMLRRFEEGFPEFVQIAEEEDQQRLVVSAELEGTVREREIFEVEEVSS